MVFLYRAAPVETVHYLEYIQSSGTQYIDTGFQPNNNTRVVVEFESTVNPTGAQGLFGARSKTTASAFTVWLDEGNNIGPQFGSNSYDKYFVNKTFYNQKLTFDLNKNVFTVDDQSVTLASSTFSSGSNLTLYTITMSGSADGRMSTGRLYSAQVYDNGTLVRDYHPAKDPDGVVCLYEELSKTYAYNAGSGTFTAGPDL